MFSLGSKLARVHFVQLQVVVISLVKSCIMKLSKQLTQMFQHLLHGAAYISHVCAFDQSIAHQVYLQRYLLAIYIALHIE